MVWLIYNVDNIIYIMNTNKPTDQKLYNKVKKQIYNKYPHHSAYRSGHLVKAYKKAFSNKYGTRKRPYHTKHTGKKTMRRLTRWFDEKWVNQRGEVGYKYKSDIYRPSIRITKNTPLTHTEITQKELKRARYNKRTKGRVNRFRKKTMRNDMNGGNANVYFKPNVSPKEMFEAGSFGGTYWRPIQSKFYKTKLRNQHLKYPKSWWKNVPDDWMTRDMKDYDKNINKYKVKVGTSLAFWESKNWIDKIHPYGWVQWYCDYYIGKRSHDDERQMKRWNKLAGKNGRFTRFLVTQILKQKAKWNDESISPKIRQVLLHWGYKLTKTDFDNEIKRRRKTRRKH